MTGSLRILLREMVRGFIDPDCDYDWSENIEAGMDPADVPQREYIRLPGEKEIASTQCPHCVGSGIRDVGGEMKKCDICDGEGQIEQ